ncbi:DUF1684 domain-containing protein [Alkalisalibacterium limincola]|nr:DUF1684 domain-containing protein [Alkalisalibacterium limincola]
MRIPMPGTAMMKLAIAMLLGGVLVACGADRDERARELVRVDAFHQENSAWQADRLERLMRPDGWLALVSRDWLVPGRHAFGGGEAVRYRFDPAEAAVGELELVGTRVVLHPLPGHALRFQGAGVVAPMDLTPPDAGASPRIGFDEGRGRFEVIRRGERFALRVMHDESPTRTGFVGLEYFPAEPGWRIEADFHAHAPGRTIPIINVLGDEEATVNPGRIEFERDGERHSLEALEGPDGTFFVVYADRTNGRDTYAGGRFLYTAPPEDGRVVIDFNRGYNPPCAFSAYTTCPLPPPENRLDLVIDAGERAYAGPSPAAAYQLQ